MARWSLRVVRDRVRRSVSRVWNYESDHEHLLIEEGRMGTYRLVVREGTKKHLANQTLVKLYFGIREVNPLVDKSSLFGVTAQKARIGCQVSNC